MVNALGPQEKNEKTTTCGPCKLIANHYSVPVQWLNLVELKREWPEAAFGSAIFWTPVCLLNFLYVPQHSRTVVVALCSFVHKTWMSWLSNRAAV